MPPKLTLAAIISKFGAATKAKFKNTAVKGEPEEQLRAPLEVLFAQIADLAGISTGSLSVVGETALADMHIRPDFAITLEGALVGFVEVKAPGKGANPKCLRGHDRLQWERLQSLPNLLYTDGNAFSLWRNGEQAGDIVTLGGDVTSAGDKLTAPDTLEALFRDFYAWQPIPPREPKQLAHDSARLCRLLRDEVTDLLGRQHAGFNSLAADWRKLLFPDADDAQFADGYAQTITFGLLMARARKIPLSVGLDIVAKRLSPTSSLIGAALRLLTDNEENQAALGTSLPTLIRVLDVVNWDVISKGVPDAWLYFYEMFLEVYDSHLRKQTGSYYTPPQVVQAMVRLVDEALTSPNSFNLPDGLAAHKVVIADPAVGTGTFMLGVLRHIARKVAEDQGEGAVAGEVEGALKRLIGFELQLGPFAVAQLRLLAEVTELCGPKTKAALRLFITDTLANPYEEKEWIPDMLRPLAESRQQASKIKREEPITVVIGNPPYKDKAKGRGGWIEEGRGGWSKKKNSGGVPPPINAWMPPAHWGVSTHVKHLHNLYVYFWRWATWKVFDDGKSPSGIICFITVAGFLNGPGFEKMRDYLRRTCGEVWVIDCSPEGHQPDVSTRVFEGVQHPVCIVLAARAKPNAADTAARVRFHALPAGHRQQKFEHLRTLTLDGDGWTDCASDWRAPFLPASQGAWADYPPLDTFFDYNGSGVMPGRTWVISPDADSLRRRWQTLTAASGEEQEALFYPHMRGGQPGDKHSQRSVKAGLNGHEARLMAVAIDKGVCVEPIPYAFRSFDRQWIIPDNRLINRPNPNLWEMHSSKQVYLTALEKTSPNGGPAFSLTGLIPDHDHYKGSFSGRVFPLWSRGKESNVRGEVLSVLGAQYGREVRGEEVMAYIAGVGAHPGYVERFSEDLKQPGLRVPMTADGGLFGEVVAVGEEVIWLHTFGERYADPKAGRPGTPPRLPAGEGPNIPKEGTIPTTEGEMPDSLRYDEEAQRLWVGEKGYVDRVPKAVWLYEVSGKQVLKQWFSYRKADRKRPLIGDKRKPSDLDKVHPSGWLPEYTKELLNVLHVLGRLVRLEAKQAALLARVCAGEQISAAQLVAAPKTALEALKKGRTKRVPKQAKKLSLPFSLDDEGA